MGSLGIDEDSAVLGSVRSQFQAPFGAREVIRGVHGNNRLRGKSLLHCVVFGRVTGVACARYVLGDKGKAISLAALASGVSVEGTKSDQAILVGGAWADTSAANTEVENDGSAVLLGNSSFCGGNSTVATDGVNGVNTRIQRQR